MARSCSACGTGSPDGARFCFHCGAPLLTASHGRERRFATALSAQLLGPASPRWPRSLAVRATARLGEEVERHGGWVWRAGADGILAAFGIPAPQEDDPERAVRAGLTMQVVLAELNRRAAGEGHPALELRVGIDSGEVMVDHAPVQGTLDGPVSGQAVDSASRLRAAAGPGAVLVGPKVHQATHPMIQYVPALLVGSQGPEPEPADPVTAWEAVRPKALPPSRARGQVAVPMIGREDDLETLQQMVKRVYRQGRPALVTVVGPPGIGKSRLASELREHAESLPRLLWWREGRCLAHANVSYCGLAEAVKAQCSILEDDPMDVVSAKARRAVGELFGDDGPAAAVEALVGVAVERAFRRDELFDAWRAFLERMASRHQLILVLEDLHWADDGLLDFVDELAERGQGPILILALAQPDLLDRRPTWSGGKRSAVTIHLDPLGPAENRLLLESLAPVAIPEDLVRNVVDRAAGSPLFTEEVVGLLHDRGSIHRNPEAGWDVAPDATSRGLPRSVEAVVTERLDLLPADERLVLQHACVVGRVFWDGAVAHMMDVTVEQVRTLLDRLGVRDVILPVEPSGFSEAQEFAFRHALLRDEAYRSLSLSERARLHVGVADWAEGLIGARGEELAEVIGTHLVLAHRSSGPGGLGHDASARAVRWARKAGDRARRLWQPAEAIRWYRSALDILASNPDASDEAERLLQACAELVGSVTPASNGGLGHLTPTIGG